MIDNISLDSLRVFYEVAKQQNITHAANKLFISQPAVTQTIQKLELQLNTKLFIRQPKGIKLTAAGESVYQQVAQALKHINSINDVLLNETQLTFGKIVIGSGTNLAKELLTEPICNFLKQYPNVQIVIKDEPQQSLMSKLLIGDVDLVVSQSKSNFKNPLEFTPLHFEHYVLISGLNYNHNIKNMEDLNGQTFIVQNENTSSRNIFNEFVYKNNVTITHMHEVSGYNMLIELCKNNIGIGLVPRYIVSTLIKEKVIRELPIATNIPTIEYGCVINTNNKTKALAEFLMFLKSKN